MFPSEVVVLVPVLTFALGVLCGGSWADELMNARSRRQARLQRDLNEQARAIRALRADEDETDI